MSDIVERLLVQSELGIMNCPEDHEYVTWGESAAEIKKLRAALEVTTTDCNEAFAENERLLAANRDVMLQWDVLKADYDRLRAALLGIRDMGPMTVDDQRWRIAKDALGR